MTKNKKAEELKEEFEEGNEEIEEVKEDTSEETTEENEVETIELFKYQRLQADFENYKRRSRQDMANMTCLGKEQVIKELLGVVDNFKRALNIETTDSNLEDFKKGMDLIYRQFNEVLNSHGLVEIEAEGNPFDPEFHQAIMQVETNCEDEDEIVLEDMQKGYKINDKVIRPSMVKVGKYTCTGGNDE